MNLPKTFSKKEHEAAIRQYYDSVTDRFLAIGGSQKTLTIHRAVWGDGVRSRTDALLYTNKLILTELESFSVDAGDTRKHLVDLGCGVGGTILYLLEQSHQPIQATGVTISPVQIKIACENALRLGFDKQSSWILGSYLDPLNLPQAHMAVAIESFILGPDPVRFFESAANLLLPGGRLVIIDDFMTDQSGGSTLHAEQSNWISSFRSGWHAHSLNTVCHTAAMARQAGLILVSDRDLTPSLRIMGLRDWFVKAALLLGSFLPLPTIFGNDYWNSLIGGNALQHGLRQGIFEYHMLIFKKNDQTGQKNDEK